MCLQSRWASNQSGLQVDLGRPFLPDRPVFSLLHLAKWPESFKAAIWGRDVMSSSPVVQCRVCGRRCEGQKCLLTFINYKWVCGETQTTISAASLRRQDTHTHTLPVDLSLGRSCDDGKYCNTSKVGQGTWQCRRSTNCPTVEQCMPHGFIRCPETSRIFNKLACFKVHFGWNVLFGI